ncbi:unnamed protein product [Notodromas monacha]|uniref:Peptidase S1 domain-containing protein n=1 Tax=Notodromas monacha TaxID=399045 RepID=A0A7R9GCN7_9CRUS|nr:unnamed protein product [Notodromas monacha]CAG0916052.1 unnamed protein product [Notodromas monacha]
MCTLGDPLAAAGSFLHPRALPPSGPLLPLGPGAGPAAGLLDDDPFHRRSVIRDRSQCYSGNCEFFAMCWATGGLLSGGCGGFFFSCCVRPGTYIAEHTYNSEPSRIQYGPVINDPTCGRSQPYGAQRRIVGGDNAGFGVFPWQAYIRIGKSRCGGSLINRRHVVTAGHCVKRATPGMVQVTLGDYVLGQEIEPLEAQKFGVVDIKVHPKFKYTPQADRYDVAVLTLDRAVEFGPHMAPVCLPEKGEDFLGERAWVAGWGAMQPGSRLRPRTLQAVDVPVINNKECEDWHKSKGITVIIYDEMTCAGWRNGGRDACQGDSGGPLMVHRYGRWYLIGLVSAGYSCAQSKQPGIYHRVSYTADWVSAVANKNRAFSRHHFDEESADGGDADAGFLDDDRDDKDYEYYK